MYSLNTSANPDQYNCLRCYSSYTTPLCYLSDIKAIPFISLNSDKILSRYNHRSLGESSHNSCDLKVMMIDLFSLTCAYDQIKSCWTSRPFDLWWVGQEGKKGLETLDTVLCSLQEFQ